MVHRVGALFAGQKILDRISGEYVVVKFCNASGCGIAVSAHRLILPDPHWETGGFPLSLLLFSGAAINAPLFNRRTSRKQKNQASGSIHARGLVFSVSSLPCALNQGRAAAVPSAAALHGRGEPLPPGLSQVRARCRKSTAQPTLRG